jgi:hypothetical protein
MDDRIQKAIEELGFASIVKVKEDHATPDLFVTVVSPKIVTGRVSATYLLEADLKQFKKIVTDMVKMATRN